MPAPPRAPQARAPDACAPDACAPDAGPAAGCACLPGLPEGEPGAVEVLDGLHWIGALDPGLRSFDVILRTDLGTSYNAYALRSDTGVTLIDTVKAEFAAGFFARLEQVARYDEIGLIVLNHLEPDHTGAVPELLRRAPQARVVLSPRGLPMLRALLGADFERYDISPVTTGHAIDLGGRRLSFFTTPYVHWPDTQCSWLEPEGVLFTCDLFGSHLCDARLFDDLVGDFSAAQAHYYDCIMRPFRSFVTAALDALEPLDFRLIAPAHGPILRADPRRALRHYRQLTAQRGLPGRAAGETLLLVCYASAYGATARLAQAIGAGAETEPGLQVSLIDLQAQDLAPFADLLEAADGIVLGSPTVNGDAVRPVWELLGRLGDVETRGKLGAAFGSFGWSGEAVRLIETRLQGLKMRLPEPGLKVRMHPGEAEMAEGFAFGQRLGAHLTGRAGAREIELAELAAPAPEAR